MTKGDLRRLFQTVLSYPFPPGVRRSVSSDLERVALYVILITSDRFAVVAFRRLLEPADVHAELAEAVAGVQRALPGDALAAPSRAGLGIALDRFGRDM